MSNEDTNGLHLSDLSVRGFRGIERLQIGRLGRVTLLGGRNGVGKTTVLEAVRVHAARGHPNVLREILDKHEELAHVLDEDLDSIVSPDYAALFNGRILNRSKPIEIGPVVPDDRLQIKVSRSKDLLRQQQLGFLETRDDEVWVLEIRYRGHLTHEPTSRSRRGWRFNRIRHRFTEDIPRVGLDHWEWPVIQCESLGPGLPSNSKLARYWDSVDLTQKEDLSLKALRLASDRIERVAVVGDEGASYRGIRRRVVVKLRGQRNPVPLKSLGDGVIRLFAAGLALANSSGGFLVVDEVENGIHYSVQQVFWRMVLRTAHEHNVQVLATTHSNDCVRGFARATRELADVGGAYVRLEREGDEVRAVEYTEKELFTVAEQGIEAR